MKKLFAILALLMSSSAMAADNGVVFTPGAGGVARSKDVGVGVQLPGVFLSDQTGAFPGAFTTFGTTPGAVLVPGVNAAAFQQGTWNISTVTTITNPVPVTESGTWTVQPGNTANTTAWLVTGTGGTFPATQSGTWSVRNVGNTGNTLDFASTQNVATPQAAILVGAEFNTVPTTITTGNSSPLQLDSAGNLLVNVKAGGAAGGTSSSFGSAFPATGTAIGLTSGTNMVAWSATTSYGTAPAAIAVPAVNAFVTNANANGRPTAASNASPIVMLPALTTFHLIAANTTNATSVKASAATLYSCQMSNNSTTAGYLKIYNKASAPTVGSDTPIKTLIIPGPAAGGGGSNISFGSGGGLTLATGFALAVTSIITDADTTAVAAATFAINCDYE